MTKWEACPWFRSSEMATGCDLCIWGLIDFISGVNAKGVKKYRYLLEEPLGIFRGLGHANTLATTSLGGLGDDRGHN